MADRISVKCLLPFTLLFRSLMFFLASRIDDPTTGFGFYVLMSFVYLSYYSVITVHLGYLCKLYPKEIRGICTGMSGFLSLAGVFAYVAYASLLES